MRSGRLYRYNVGSAGDSEVSQLEVTIAQLEVMIVDCPGPHGLNFALTLNLDLDIEPNPDPALILTMKNMSDTNPDSKLPVIQTQ